MNGPKTAAKLSPWRPVPTPIDGVVSAEDALLLTYAYQSPTRFTWTNTFFKFVASQYGPAILNTGLRQAVLARTAVSLCKTFPEFRERADKHNRQAWTEFYRKADPVKDLDEADIYAITVLADVAWEIMEDKEARDVIRRCRTFTTKFVTKHSSGKLSTINPFCLQMDDIDFYDMGISSKALEPQSLLQSQGMSFRDRVREYDILRSIEPSKWGESVFNALYAAFYYLLLRLVCCLQRIAVSDAGILVHRSEGRQIGTALERIRFELNDIELQTALTSWLSKKGKLQPGLTDEEVFEAEARTLFSQQQECFRLGFIILEAPTILDGLVTPNARSTARDLISSIRTFSPREFRKLNEYFTLKCYSIVIVLSAMTLSPEEIPDGNFSKGKNC